MKPEQQRIAIAEACGWKFSSSCDTPTAWGGWQTHPESYISEDGRVVYDEKELPDYLNDLNAMHEAEKTLKDGDMLYYPRALEKVTDGTIGCFVACHATAAQRAEAFLKTIRKWKE